MIDLFDDAAETDSLVKEALIGQLGAKAVGYGASLLKGVGGAVVRNPGKTLAAGLTALELGSGAANGARAAAKGKGVGTFMAGPQF